MSTSEVSPACGLERSSRATRSSAGPAEESSADMSAVWLLLLLLLLLEAASRLQAPRAGLQDSSRAFTHHLPDPAAGARSMMRWWGGCRVGRDVLRATGDTSSLAAPFKSLVQLCERTPPKHRTLTLISPFKGLLGASTPRRSGQACARRRSSSSFQAPPR